MKVTFHGPVDQTLLCAHATCDDAVISNRGIIGSEFYRYVNNTKRKFYVVQIYVDEEGTLEGELLKITEEGPKLKVEITPTLDVDTLRFKVPRVRLHGHTKGRIIRWNAYSAFWHPEGTGFCEFDAKQAFSGACVDWVPEEQDGKHTLRSWPLHLPRGVAVMERFGTHRSLEPAGALPQQAKRLDATSPLTADELAIDVEFLNIDSASWHQLKTECDGDAETHDRRGSWRSSPPPGRCTTR